MVMQEALAKEPTVSVNRVIWSPDGSLFGVTYSQHIVHIYTFHGGNDLRHHLEIDAHIEGVCSKSNCSCKYPCWTNHSGI